MKLTQLLAEGVKKINAGMFKTALASGYANGDDHSVFLVIIRGHGQITTIESEEQRLDCNISYKDQGVVGTVTIGATAGFTPTRLIDIEIEKKFRTHNIATTVVTILANCADDGELIINDIQPKAKGFWDKFNPEYFEDEDRTDMISAKIRVE